MLLPFYIMRYEKDIHEMSENPEMFQSLLNDYEEIRINLERELITPQRLIGHGIMWEKTVKKPKESISAELISKAIKLFFQMMSTLIQ